MGEGESWSHQGTTESQRQTHWGWEECKLAQYGLCDFSNMNGEHTHVGCALFSECILTYIMCVFFPECHAAGWESGPEEPAQTTGNSKLQPAGSDSGCAETDCFFTGEQYNTTDTERQTAGTLHYTSYTIQYSVDSFSQRNTLQTDNKAASLAVYNWNVK